VQPASSKESTEGLHGGEFLLKTSAPDATFPPEDFTDEHRAINRTTDEFWAQGVAPKLDAIQHQESGVAVSLLKKSGELELLAVVVPERYGGMDMDLTSAILVAESVAREGSYEGYILRTSRALLKRLTKFEPVTAIEERRTIARRLPDAERYTF